MANRAACQAVLDYLLTFPDMHLQSEWAAELSDASVAFHGLHGTHVCNTVMCVAGAASYLAGDLNIIEEPGKKPRMMLLGKPVEDWEGVAEEKGYTDYDQYFNERGQELLGLDDEVAHHLFFCTTNESALELLKELANGNDQAVYDEIDNCEDCNNDEE